MRSDISVIERVIEKKERAKKIAMGVFYFLGVAAGILGTNMIVATIGLKETESFCSDNSDICKLYTGGISGPSLVDNVRFSGYFTAGMGSVFAAVIFGIISVSTLCCFQKSPYEEYKDLHSNNDSNNDSDGDYRFFSKLKNAFRPIKKELTQLMVGLPSLLGSTALLSLLVVFFIKNDFCNVSEGECFPKATPDQLQKIIDFSDGLYQTLKHSAINFNVVTNSVLSIGMMAVVAWIEHRDWSNAESENLQNIDAVSYYGAVDGKSANFIGEDDQGAGNRFEL